eukprot:4471803-Karenia_brevis.AAC.1
MERTGQVCTKCPVFRKHLTAFKPYVKAWDWGTDGKHHLYRCIYADIEGDGLVMRELNDYCWDARRQHRLGRGLL